MFIKGAWPECVFSADVIGGEVFSGYSGEEKGTIDEL